MFPAPESEDAPPSAEASKAAWRAWARRRRANGDPIESGRLVAGHLAHWPTYRAAAKVLIYLAFGDEPDLGPLLEDEGKSFYTTRTAAAGEPSLSLHRLDLEHLERHPFGFLQPGAEAVTEPAEDLDLVLVPGLAFDTLGNRLGFGLGFYDRLLSSLGARVPLVGITASALLVPRLPSESHDVRMTHLASEDGIFPVGG